MIEHDNESKHGQLDQANEIIRLQQEIKQLRSENEILKQHFERHDEL
ncbi:hypothetical protein [Vibrio sp. 10N]|nr:hypothetical protein VB10N_36400 [Vibrio sp. 10N]